MMTALKMIDGQNGESLTHASARRLREQLAGRRIKQTELVASLGVSKMWLSRRLAGDVAMSTEDLERIEKATGISAAYLVTGVNTENRRPDGPDGGLSNGAAVHPPGLEPGTHWLRVSADDEGGPDNVVPLFPSGTPAHPNQPERIAA